MPSEQHLHPVSLLFLLGRGIRPFFVPAVLAFFATGGSGPPVGFGPPGMDPGGPAGPAGLEWFGILLLVPASITAVARYLSFRLRYEGADLVIRSGIVFRNVRHVPYARIQNLDAVQNVFHRLLGVIEVRVQTGSGTEPEATISVLPVAAFEDMRRRVFAGRAAAVAATDEPGAPAVVAASPAPRTVLSLGLGELVRYGLIENKGFIVIGAVLGGLWETGLLDRLGNRFFGQNPFGSGLSRETLEAMGGPDGISMWRLVTVVAGIAAFLVFVRVVSMGWAIVRLYGFRLTRVGDDLRSEYGLLTRVAATIPLRRVQTLTVDEGLLQRIGKRASVRVETAGGAGVRQGAGGTERPWLAPIVPLDQVPPLVHETIPEVDLGALAWQPVHAHAFRRVVKRHVAGAVALTGVVTPALGWWAPVVLVVAVSWAAFTARQHARHLRWAVTDDVIAFRRGWLSRSMTLARTEKIQVVTVTESPFDRLRAMAGLRVDTAGSLDPAHLVRIPYLAREVAMGLYERLGVRAATTAFRW